MTSDPASEAAAIIASTLRASLEGSGGTRRVALAGGSSPRTLYAALATHDLPWSRIEWWFGDERMVERDHADSNFGMAEPALFSRLDAPRVAAVETGLPIVEAAADYERRLRQQPLDIAILGMGEDGHTASLFPGQTHPSGRWAVPVTDSPKPPPERVSLTLEAISHASLVLVFVVGAKKAEVLSRIWRDEAPSLPAAQVRAAGRLVWVVDEAAGLR